MRFTLVSVLAALALCGCASVKYTPYGGSQNWPVGKTSSIEQNAGVVPIYSAPPADPYNVIGVVKVSGGLLGSNFAAMLASQRAWDMGAGALVRANGQNTPVVASTKAKGNALANPYESLTGPAPTGPAARKTASFIAIRWKPSGPGASGPATQ